MGVTGTAQNHTIGSSPRLREDRGPLLLRNGGLLWRVFRDRSYAAEVPRVSIYGTGVEDRALPAVEGPGAAPRILRRHSRRYCAGR